MKLALNIKTPFTREDAVCFTSDTQVVQDFIYKFIDKHEFPEGEYKLKVVSTEKELSPDKKFIDQDIKRFEYLELLYK